MTISSSISRSGAATVLDVWGQIKNFSGVYIEFCIYLRFLILYLELATLSAPVNLPWVYPERVWILKISINGIHLKN